MNKFHRMIIIKYESIIYVTTFTLEKLCTVARSKYKLFFIEAINKFLLYYNQNNCKI